VSSIFQASSAVAGGTAAPLATGGTSDTGRMPAWRPHFAGRAARRRAALARRAPARARRSRYAPPRRCSPSSCPARAPSPGPGSDHLARRPSHLEEEEECRRGHERDAEPEHAANPSACGAPPPSRSARRSRAHRPCRRRSGAAATRRPARGRRGTCASCRRSGTRPSSRRGSRGPRACGRGARSSR
jgi:hypothetical protein